MVSASAAAETTAPNETAAAATNATSAGTDTGTPTSRASANGSTAGVAAAAAARLAAGPTGAAAFRRAATAEVSQCDLDKKSGAARAHYPRAASGAFCAVCVQKECAVAPSNGYLNFASITALLLLLLFFIAFHFDFPSDIVTVGGFAQVTGVTTDAAAAAGLVSVRGNPIQMRCFGH